jgi:hypothetical protein
VAVKTFLHTALERKNVKIARQYCTTTSIIKTDRAVYKLLFIDGETDGHVETNNRFPHLLEMRQRQPKHNAKE